MKIVLLGSKPPVWRWVQVPSDARLDWLPTLLEACGVAKPASFKLDGVSLLPLLTARVAPAEWPDRKRFFHLHRGPEPKRYQNCAVVTQNHKLVGYPNTFDKDDLATSTSNPVLELYSLADDFGEQKDLAKARPEVLAELRRAYDAWFDSVQGARQFEPGVIHLGNPAENPLHLCRYQDATYVSNEPRGWLVEIERGGKYEITLPRGESSEAGQLVVSWQGRETRTPAQFQPHVQCTLASGQFYRRPRCGGLGRTRRKVILEEGALGDVEVRRVE